MYKIVAYNKKIKYEKLKELFKNADTLYKVRNTIKKIDYKLNGHSETLCVKKFKKLSFLKSIIFFLCKKTSKAKKAYHNALFLKKKGVSVPEPVDYIEVYKNNLLVESYYIDLFKKNVSDLKKEMINIFRNEPDTYKFLALIEPVAKELKKMHDAGFLQNDIGAQNTFIERVDKNKWGNVSIIDLNRGQIYSKLSLKQRAKDLSRLEIPSEFKKIFFRMYFEKEKLPPLFVKYENFFRALRKIHTTSHKLRHPFKSYLKKENKVEGEKIGSHKNLWLWDEKSGQPSILVSSKERKKSFNKADILKMVFLNLLNSPFYFFKYKKLRKRVFKNRINLKNKIGVSIEVKEDINERLKVLFELEIKVPVMIRVYFHKKNLLENVYEAVKKLHKMGYEVSIAVCQDRKACLNPEDWDLFLENIFLNLNSYIKFAEITHAVNRVKWGIWNFYEFKRLYKNVSKIKKNYPQIYILGPSVNDFEYYYYAPALNISGDKIDGLSCHLYVDRRGAPENFQGNFSLLQKCIAGKAIANTFFIKNFYITETNWPLNESGPYSPIEGPYSNSDSLESPLHVSTEIYARYMIRYFLISLCSGMVEKIWWWRLCAHGFGICDDLNSIKKRKAFYALKNFLKQVQNSEFIKYEKKCGCDIYFFENFFIIYKEKEQKIIDLFELLKSLDVHILDFKIFDLYGNKIAKNNKITINGEPKTITF
ncbi:MAG: lipopolysaccharide kinase InaA family protein [Candidatus Muiribacteriota bacterium]